MMTENPQGQKQGSRKRRWILPAATGFLAGIVLTATAVWLLMPGMMLHVEPSRLGFDETVAAIEDAAVARDGWVVAGVRDMNKSLAKHGVSFSPRVKLIEICSAEHASSVLDSDRELATLMPCAIAVYETEDGRVMISRMNTGLMGTMFGGNVAEVMGEYVANDEEAILADVVRN